MKPIKPKNLPLTDFFDFDENEMITRSENFYSSIRTRRSIRHFSDRRVPKELIENCIRAAGTAPSGANLQPWQFVVVENPEIKSQIRTAAELEEKQFYEERAPEAWLKALAPLGTDWQKPFLEIAPYLIAVFYKNFDINEAGEKTKNYYAHESVGIATGFLIAALHLSGLATLTHTPSPMGFLNEILRRPANEKPFLLLVVGYPAKNATVPSILKKSLDDIVVFL